MTVGEELVFVTAINGDHYTGFSAPPTPSAIITPSYVGVRFPRLDIQAALFHAPSSENITHHCRIYVHADVTEYPIGCWFLCGGGLF